MKGEKMGKPKDESQMPSAKGSSARRDEAMALVNYRVHSAEGTDWMLNDGEDTLRGELHPFDLEERTAKFGESVVRFVKRIPRGSDYPENNRLIDQLVGAGTSIGANYCEANDSVSKKDFKFTINRCLKESKEARFFLRMIATSEPALAADARALYREASELIRIFATIYRK